MADTDAYAIEDPQTRVLVAHAATELWERLSCQGPTNSVSYYERKREDAAKKAAQLGIKFAMKQPPIVKTR